MSKVTYRAAIYCNEHPINNDGHCLFKENQLGCIVLPDEGKGYLIALTGFEPEALEANLDYLVEEGAADLVANGFSISLDEVERFMGNYRVVREFTIEVETPEWGSHETNAEKMFIEDTPFEAGELQFIYFVDLDKVFPALNLGLDEVPHKVLCQVVRALAADGEFHTLEDVQTYGYLELQREEEVD